MNRIEMPASSSVCAKTPPACMLNGCPMVSVCVRSKAQPALFPFADSQVVLITSASTSTVLEIEQPEPEWRVSWFCVASFTFSV